MCAIEDRQHAYNRYDEAAQSDYQLSIGAGHLNAEDGYKPSKYTNQ